MIVILGLIILVATVVVGVAGVLSNGGSGHALTHGFAVFGYHVTGSAGTLFLSGIVVGAVGILGLSLPAAHIAWRMSSRWREENYLLARNWFALDALDSYAAAPDDPDRLVPNPAKKAAAAKARKARAAAEAAEQDRDTALLQLRAPAPGTTLITNQQLNGLQPPVDAAGAKASAARAAAAATPARTRLGDLAPDTMPPGTEVKLITHAIRMAACNTETALARALTGNYARAEDEAYALIREALTTSGDIEPRRGILHVRLDPLTAPRRTRALAAQLN
jgi:hypothetical protein